MLWVVLIAAALIAVGIVGVRGTVTRIVQIGGAVTALAVAGLVMTYVVPIVVALAAFGILVALFVAVLSPSEEG